MKRTTTRQDRCFFRKIVHVPSGTELPYAIMRRGTYIEKLDLSGPQLHLVYRDVRNTLSSLGMKEYDEFSVSMSDDWEGDGTETDGRFTALKVESSANEIRVWLMYTPVYELKRMATQTRVFHNVPAASILGAVARGLTPGLCTCGVVNDYHVIAGERPSTTLRQLAEEQGALVWAARGRISMMRMAELCAAAARRTYQHGYERDGVIYWHGRTSDQLGSQDANFRSFTGWDEVKGRIRTSPSIPFFSGLSGRRMAPSQTSAQTGYTLNAAPVATQRCVSIVVDGDLSVEAGQAFRMKWFTGDAEDPIDTSLPDRAVAETVAHDYTPGRFFTRIVGTKAAAAI